MESFVVDTTEEPGGVLRVRVAGVIDFVAAGAVRTELLLAVTGAEKVRVDLSGLEFTDSSGLSALVGGFNEARRRGVDYVLCGLTPAMWRVLAVTRLLEVLPVEGTPPVPVEELSRAALEASADREP